MMMKKMKMKLKMKKEMESKKESQTERETERRGEKDEEAKGEEQTQTRTPNTYALARTTFEITIGCLSEQALSRRLQVQHRQKTCPTVGLFGPWFKTRSNETRKKKNTRARELVHKCRLPRIESTPTRCSTSRQKFKPAKRFSVVSRGARTGTKHRAWRSSCRARHSVERDMSSELCRRSTLRVCRGVSVTETSISARASLVRRLFSGREWSGAPQRSSLIFVLMLSSDHSGRNASISRGFRPSTSRWRS